MSSSLITLSNEMLTVSIDQGRGAAITSVVHRPTGIHWLREASDPADREAHAFTYGMPPLFPPGRVANGTFPMGSKIFHWPLNDHAGPATLHGFGWDLPWRVGHHARESVELWLDSDAARAGFGAQFVLTIVYRVVGASLTIDAQLVNQDENPIPAALGFHTDISLSASDWHCAFPSLAPWALDSALIPTGRLGEPLIHPRRLGSALLEDQPYRLLDGEPHHIVLAMTDGPLIVHMKGDDSFRQLVLYRPTPDADFFSVEPYTWVSNAPNLALPDALTGLIRLAPGAQQAWRYEVFFETKA